MQFFLLEGKGADGRDGFDGMGVGLEPSEEAVGLEHDRRCERLLHAEGSVVGAGLAADVALVDDGEPAAGVAAPDDDLSRIVLLEVDAEPCHDVRQLLPAHADEERKGGKVIPFHRRWLLCDGFPHALLCDGLAHGRRVPHGVLPVFVTVDEVDHELGMALQDCLRFVEAEHHEGCGVGIGRGTVVG